MASLFTSIFYQIKGAIEEIHFFVPFFEWKEELLNCNFYSQLKLWSPSGTYIDCSKKEGLSDVTELKKISLREA